MHLNAEVYHTLFLSPAEVSDLRAEVPDLTGSLAEQEFPLERYPTISRILYALVDQGLDIQPMVTEET